jgi:hypothetical protein
MVGFFSSAWWQFKRLDESTPAVFFISTPILVATGTVLLQMARNPSFWDFFEPQMSS